MQNFIRLLFITSDRKRNLEISVYFDGQAKIGGGGMENCWGGKGTCLDMKLCKKWRSTDIIWGEDKVKFWQGGCSSCSPLATSLTQWRLFIDSFTKSLEEVLFHNGNIYPSIPFAYSLQMKEDYESVKQLLTKIDCAQFKWYVCGDLGFLLGLQGGWIHKTLLFFVLVV